jgi:hypothetical protein
MKRAGIYAGSGLMRWMTGAAARHRLKGLPPAPRLSLPGQESNWSAAHERYLGELVLPHPAMKMILEEYLQAIGGGRGRERIARCEAAMRELLEPWRLGPAVRALMALKGFRTVAAMILVSPVGRSPSLCPSAPGHDLSRAGPDRAHFQ